MPPRRRTPALLRLALLRLRFDAYLTPFWGSWQAMPLMVRGIDPCPACCNATLTPKLRKTCGAEFESAGEEDQAGRRSVRQETALGVDDAGLGGRHGAAAVDDLALGAERSRVGADRPDEVHVGLERRVGAARL